MSKTVDERVVSMQFDNKNFESNVKTTMSTLDKLKQSLKLENSAKGLENINAAAKTLSFDSIADSVSKLERRFSVLGIVGMRVIENLTDSMMRLAKNTVNFLTSGITQGGIKRAMNLENAHFQLQGLLKDEEAVAAVMKNVNDSVDGTAYSLDAAAKVASQFSASGMRAGDEMLKSLKAVAGVAAMTNSEYEEIGRIFTKVAGQGRLMGDDLLSLSSRGMNAAATLAESMGTTESAVREMVSKGQIDFKTFAFAMDDAFGEHAKKANETLTGALSNVKAALARIVALFVSPLVEQNGELVQLLNNVRAKINDIKNALVPVADYVVNIVKNLITKVSAFVEKLDVGKYFSKLGEMLTSSKWDVFIKKINDAGISTDKFQEKLKEVASKHGVLIDDLIKKYGTLGNVISAGKISKSIITETLKNFVDVEKDVSVATTDVTDKLEYFDKIINEVIRGNYGVGATRMKALADAGYDYAKTQKLINYVWERNEKTWSNCTVTAEELTNTIGDLSTEELKSIGYTDEQAKKIRELAEEATKTDTPLSELISSLGEISKPSAKVLIIDSLKNGLQGLVSIAKALKDAFFEVFDFSKASGAMYGFLEVINEFSKKLVFSEKRANKLKRTFKGLFAVIDILRMTIGSGLNIAFKILKAILSGFNVDILDFTANVGDAIVKFRDWLKENSLLSKAIDFLVPIIKTMAAAIKDTASAVYDWAKSNETIQNLGGKFVSLIQNIISFFDKLKESIKERDWKNFGINITQGLASGIRSGISKAVSMIKNLGKAIIETFCNILGIASPSKLFIELGEFIISGLIKGLSNGFSAVFEIIKSLALGIYNTMASALDSVLFQKVYRSIKSIGDKLREAFKSWNFNLGGIVIVGTIISFIIVLKKLAETAERLAKITVNALNPLEKLGEKIGDILSAVKNYIGEMAKAHSFKAKSEGFKSIAIAIALLAGSFYLLSRLDWPAVARGSVAIVVISGALALLAKAISKMGTIDIAKVSSFMLGFSVAIYVLSAAMKKLSGIYIGDVLSPIIMLTVMMTGMIIALKILGDAVSDPKTGKGISKAGGLFVKMAISIGIMALVIKTIAGIPKGDIDKAINIITGIFLMYASMAILGSISKDAHGVGSMLLNMSLAIGIIVIVMKQIAGIKDSDIVKGLLTIAAIEYLFAAIIAVSIFAGEHASKAGTMLLKMAFAIGVLALSMKIIATLSYEDVLKGLITMAGVESLFLRFIFISKICRKEANNVGSMMLKMAAGMTLMAMAIKLIARIPTGDIIKGLAFISAIEVLFGAMVMVSKFSGEYADKAGTMLLKMSAGILILVAAIALLSLLKPETVAVGTAAIVAMITSLAAVANAASKLGDCTKQLLIIGGIIAILVGAVVGLSFIEKDKLLAATASISSIIGMFALLLIATKYVNSFDVGTIKNLGAMLGIVIALGAILLAIQALEIRSSIETVASISILLIAMAATLRILDSVDSVSGKALLGMAGLSVIISMIGGVLWLLKAMDVAPSIETATSLSVLLLAMAAAVRILSSGYYDLKSMGVAMLATLAMSVILLAIGGVLLALKAMDVAPSMETALALSVMLLAFAGAVAILGIIGPLAVGALVGAVAMAGVIEVVKDVMIGLGELASKTPMAEKFLGKGIEILKKIGKGIGEFISSIGVGLTSGLPEIGENVSKFIEYFSSIKPETADGIKMVSKAISTIAGAGLADKLSKILGMGGLFEDLKEDLPSIGEGLKSFISELGTLKPEQIESVESACEVLNALSEAAKNIDGRAEWAKKIFGDNGLGAFTSDLPDVAENLVTFVSNLGIVTEDQLNSVKMACSVIKELAKAGGEIDGQAEWSKKIFGDNGLGAFASDLPDVGGKLSGFVTGLGTITEDQVTSVKSACSVITALAGASKNIDGQAEWAKKIFGDNGLGAFSGDLPTVASNLKSFVDNLGAFGEDKIATVRSAVGIVNALANLSDSNLKMLATYLPSVGVYMVSFADDIVSFCDKLKGTSADSITSSVKTVINDIASIAENSLGEMNDVGTDLAGAISTGFSSNKTSMHKAVVSVLNAAKKAVTDNVDFKSTGDKLGSSLITGLNDKEEKIKSAAEELAKAAKTAITDRKDDFVEAGKDLGRGLIKGIKDKEDDVYDAGFKLGKAAVRGEKDGQKSKSPSKLTIKAGKWLGEGLVIGMTRMGKAVYNAGHDMGDNAIGAVSKAIASISDVVNSDVDTQPTIRPVMDLDNVRSGMDTMSRMLGATPSVGVLANVNAISSSMRGGQNGTSDVVSAIKDIGKKLGSSGGDTYQINGITYDDGSNIAEAVKTLVRATKVERRR